MRLLRYDALLNVRHGLPVLSVAVLLVREAGGPARASGNFEQTWQSVLLAPEALFFSKGDYIFTFRIIQRLTNHIGKGLAFSASLHRDHPNVDTLVREVLDSIRFDD